jgi:hypothetical protein
MDPALVHFTLNTHLTPQGLVDIVHHRRKPQPVSDSSFRPLSGAHTINDWTSKVNEPPLHVADSFQQFLIWQWNLAISYPHHDRHTRNDDVQCTFPCIKYNPNLFAMHSALLHSTTHNAHEPHIWRQHKSLELGTNCTCAPAISPKALAQQRHPNQSKTISSNFHFQTTSSTRRKSSL